MLTLIENGNVYTPEPLGRASILLVDGKIGKVGAVDRRAVERCGIECEVIDAAGCLVVPGLIDPHLHLLGGSGESGFSTQSPEFFTSEIVPFGITTVVGLLGVDTTMKTMAGLLAKVKGLKEEGLNAYVWSGGYNVPPNSILGSIRDDVMFIDEVIGAGEVAISDRRDQAPTANEIARLVSDCHAGGMLARKAGLTHFHVGDARGRLAPLREVLNEYDVEPGWLYPTHITRSDPLLREAVGLAKKGVPVDTDVVEEDLPRWLARYLELGGPPDQLTISSDASLTSPCLVLEQMRACILERGFPMEQVLSLATRNTARILQLREKGTIEKGKMGDLLILAERDLEVVHVLSRGKFMVRNGRTVVRERFLDESNREIHLSGTKEERSPAESSGAADATPPRKRPKPAARPRRGKKAAL